MRKRIEAGQIERLVEIKGEILDLLEEAVDIVRGTPEEQRSHHWYASFCTALDKDHVQASDSTCTLQETIDALRTN